MTPLAVLETTRLLRVARSGRLNPWLGPAIRGLAGGRLRARSCVLPVVEQLTVRRYCTGCPHMIGCAYGETVEPDPPPGARLPAGWEPPRPLVVAPVFPLPNVAEPGFVFPVRVVFVGRTALGHAGQFWDALRVGGADPMLGLGEDRLLFDVLPPNDATPDVRFDLTLPIDPADEPGTAAGVRLTLTGPLILHRAGNDGDRRLLVMRPLFTDLVRAGLRAIGPLYRCYAEALPDSVFGRVKEAATKVRTVRAEFNTFAQGRRSSRSRETFTVRGVTGRAEFESVPRWLVMWLRWAGRLHVGTHRVAGAGGWELEVDE